MPGEFALTRQNSSHGSPSLPRHPAIRLRHPVLSSLVRAREERWIERNSYRKREEPSEQTNRRDARVQQQPPLSPFTLSYLLPYPLTELTGRNGVPLLDVRRGARGHARILRRPIRTNYTYPLCIWTPRVGPTLPAAIYYRARCLVQFTYDYADAPVSAPTYASAAQGGKTGKMGKDGQRGEEGKRDGFAWLWSHPSDCRFFVNWISCVWQTRGTL